MQYIKLYRMFLYMKRHYYNDTFLNAVEILKIDFINSILKIRFIKFK